MNRIALLAVLIGIFGINCMSVQLPESQKILEIYKSENPMIPIGPSYIKIVTPPHDSIRPIYLDGCYIGTVVDIDSIGMFTGPHSLSFLSEWEKEYYRERYNYRTSCLTPGTPIYTGAGSKIVMTATLGAFMQPGQTQTFQMDYSKVERAIKAAEEGRGGPDVVWLIVPIGVAFVIGWVVIGSLGE